MLSTLALTLVAISSPAATGELLPDPPSETILVAVDEKKATAQGKKTRRRAPRGGDGRTGKGAKPPSGPPSGVDPLTMTGTQLGVGAGTLAACGALSCASFLCVSTGGVLPGLTGCGLGCLASPLVFAHCALSGAAAGAMEGLVANWFGQQRSPLLYTTLGGAGTGALFGVLASGFWLSALAFNQGHVDGGAPFEPLPFVNADPFARNLTIAAFVSVFLGALATPVVPAVVYALFAKNARAGQPPRLLGEGELEPPKSRAPALAQLSGASEMAF